MPSRSPLRTAVVALARLAIPLWVVGAGPAPMSLVATAVTAGGGA